MEQRWLLLLAFVLSCSLVLPICLRDLKRIRDCRKSTRRWSKTHANCVWLRCVAGFAVKNAIIWQVE